MTDVKPVTQMQHKGLLRRMSRIEEVVTTFVGNMECRNTEDHNNVNEYLHRRLKVDDDQIIKAFIFGVVGVIVSIAIGSSMPIGGAAVFAIGLIISAYMVCKALFLDHNKFFQTLEEFYHQADELNDSEETFDVIDIKKEVFE